jgi:hypothetical protein
MMMMMIMIMMNKIIFLPWVADHYHIRGEEKSDVLAKKIILITESREREISYYQNHNLDWV